ncbi:methyl-accepting chemotaxis protein [Haloferax sp. S1W]|uniref:methyl-accepting chemotaxis protein n=1 Tax=Haloferax sp. S1W TaxID=3377110 RepID=UPI0037C99F32
MKGQAKRAGLDWEPSDSLTETERLEAERDFWKGLFEQVVEDLPEPTFVVDDEGRLTHINDLTFEKYGLDESDLGKKGIDAFGTKGKDEILAEKIARTDQVIREAEFREVPTDDGTLWNRSMGFPLHAPNGDVVGAFELTPITTDIVEKNQQMSAAQEQLSEEVSGSIQDAMTSADDVSDSVTAAREIAAQQADAMEEVSGEVGSLSATVEEIAASADEINRQSTEAQHLAEESREDGEIAAEAMDRVAEGGEHVADRTHELAEHIEEIDDIIEVINDIADQTNILALNANIEAARAGDAGAGFAVVADEVKSLANEVQAESERIEEIISETREDATETVEGIESLTEDVRDSAERIDTLIENQDEIAATIREAATGMDDIANATDDQAVRTEEVASMVDNAAQKATEVQAETAKAVSANDTQIEVVADISESVRQLEARMAGLNAD